jgi:putative nucleotidyltransferase with HDIG domain
MNPSMNALIEKRVDEIETTPSIPAVLMPLLKLLNAPSEQANLDEIIRLVSYDQTIAAQCLRVASSPLFGLSHAPQSIRAAVTSLGLRRVQTILLTCCLGKAFPAKQWVLDPNAFWKHSLGCAMVCRKFSEKLASSDKERAYTAGLLHDIGLMVNCMAFAKEFEVAVKHAAAECIPLEAAEMATMGFTHQDTGRALAEKWHLGHDIAEVISHHHAPELSTEAQPLVALVHLSDQLCRVRGMGYGYDEGGKVDLVNEPAWQILLKAHRDIAGVDFFRFTLELDDAVGEVCELVAAVFDSSASAKGA